MNLVLPIDKFQDAIVETIQGHQVTILVGPTGSGKTVRTPLFLLNAGLGFGGRIAVTEPRRIAARSVAEFSARLAGVTLGKEIGYQIRHDDRTSVGTMLTYMTEGILLREMQEDPDLSRYEVIVVDEAHERGINCDFLLALLKELLKRRSDLKVVVMSATINAQKFAAYFDNAPIINVEGKMYPVETIYRPLEHLKLHEEIAALVADIHQTTDRGDVMVFLPDVDTIHKTAREIEALNLAGLKVVPVYGQMTNDQQAQAFQEFPGYRKVIVGTNILETSITAAGARFGIDSGLIKQAEYNSLTGIGSLFVVDHSQSGSDQRLGRLGRTEPGVMYRLYTEDNYHRRPRFTSPEIQRTSLAGVVLQSKELGIPDVEVLEFLDQPDREDFRAAYRTLVSLGALNPGNGLTDLGRKMARLPMEPHKAKQLLVAADYGCLYEMAVIVAVTSANKHPFLRIRDESPDKSRADAAQKALSVTGSDHLTYLNVYRKWEENNRSRSWANENFVNYSALEEASRILEQLLEILRTQDYEIKSSSSDEDILTSVAAGLIDVVSFAGRGMYALTHSVTKAEVYIHPSSVLMNAITPQALVANELVTSGQGRKGPKTYARTCSKIDPKILVKIAPNRCTTEIMEPSVKGDIVVAPEVTKFDGIEIARTETQVKGPEASRALAKHILENALSGLGLYGTKVHPVGNTISDLYRSLTGSHLSYDERRGTFRFIIEAVLEAQLRHVWTLSEAKTTRLAIPRWVTPELVARESVKLYPAQVILNGRPYRVKYLVGTTLVGLPKEVAAKITWADFEGFWPETTDLLQVTFEGESEYGGDYIRVVKEQLAREGLDVVPMGTRQPITFAVDATSQRPREIPEEVKIGGILRKTTLPVAIDDMAGTAEIHVPEELTEEFQKWNAPDIYPYFWRIFFTFEGEEHQVNDPKGIRTRIASIEAAKEARIAAQKRLQEFRQAKLEVAKSLKALLEIADLPELLASYDRLYDGDTNSLAALRDRINAELAERRFIAENRDKLAAAMVDHLTEEMLCPICLEPLDDHGRCERVSGHTEHMLRYPETEDGSYQDLVLMDFRANGKVAARVVAKPGGVVQLLNQEEIGKDYWDPTKETGEIEVLDYTPNMHLTPDEYGARSVRQEERRLSRPVGGK